jgi:hypothetical protein
MAGKLTYQNLQHITHTQDPFKGTMRFPMYSDRRQSHCYFTMVEANGEIEYHVAYGNTTDRLEITQQTFNMYKDVRGRAVHEDTNKAGEKVYFEHKRSPRVMAIVRSDNTIEYTRENYWQGDRMKMSEWMSNGRGWNHPIYYFDSYRFGGNGLVDYRDGRKVTLPIFKGLRINADTLEPHESQKIQVFRRVVDRKKSKKLMERYKTKLDIAHAMLKCIDTDTMMVSAKDLYAEHCKTNEEHGYTYFPVSDALKIGDDLLEEGSEFEASILYAIGLELQGFSAYAIQNFGSSNRYYRSVCEPSKLVPNIKARLSKAVYKSHSPFHEEEVPFLQSKGSEWGLRVVVNGVEVVR